MNWSARWRHLLVLLVVVSFLSYDLMPRLLKLLVLPSPPLDYIDNVTQWEQQVAAFRNRLPQDEPVGYRLLQRPGEQFTLDHVQLELMLTRYAVCPTVVNATDRTLNRRIINTGSRLSYKD